MLIRSFVRLFALQSPRFIGTPAAFSKRGAILQWFPARLAQLQNLNNIPSAVSHDVYMHCSYDIAANKHDVKKALNQVIRRHIETEYGWQDRDVTKIGYRNGKPVICLSISILHTQFIVRTLLQ
ncbi:O-linked N-acetylglucosaminetransferase [Actinobacillus ureae]|nr:O-linked N-acetylglucosaminetransferase [Actinobacillus ureae]SUU49837.1 O-linked N-acetylglucosaminetransferase [Actinobacillus ureae]